MKSRLILLVLLAVVAATPIPAGGKEEISSLSSAMTDSPSLIIQVGQEQFPVELLDNPASKSLLDQLPLSVEFEDFAGLEKIFYPPKKLSKNEAPSGAKPVKGNIMYYAPWGDVAIFYKDAAYASGLIPLGNIENVDGLVQAIKHVDTATLFKP
ncbi:hypothetical protein J0A68_12990 [Algoriphagus sp. H41]|uniref:Cyclophilin-like domain-containing protein n=1 Tax=Algoriphagus oliviformis TaxID=2811231 RepID=A0ABS3C430_9BACT|nr:cyclophilin-like fold protein [Algoriphagus oliviformis]MBN7811864.1 hypothetical protein [Algoriphagus oliviformis]